MLLREYLTLGNTLIKKVHLTHNSYNWKVKAVHQQASILDFGISILASDLESISVFYLL